jgi:hypothetical protein
MNKKNVILEIIRHPAIKRILEARKIPTSIVARLIVEELMEQEQDQYEGQVEVLNKLMQKKLGKFLNQIKKFLETRPKGVEAFSALMGEMDPQQLLEVLGDKSEWFKGRKVQIEKEAKAGKLDYAAFLLMNEFKKWEAQYKEAYEAYNTATGAGESGNPDQQSYKKFRAIALVWKDMFDSASSIIDEYAKQDEPDPNERKKLVEALLKAKDIKTFLAIYKKLAGEEYKEQFIGTVKVVKALIDLKKQLSDNPDELLEKGIALLDKNYIEKKLYMDLEQISEKIRDKIFELITEIKLDQEPEKFMKQPFENLLLDLRKVGDMKTKLEVISKRFPEYMTPDNGLKTLDDLNEYKNLFMALVGGRTMEKGALDEEEGKPTLPGQQEARQFLIGIIAYYKLSEKENYEKIKADDERFKKELARIMKAADHMDAFNRPLADALRKFVKDQEKEDCIVLLKKLIEMFTSKYDLDEKAFAQLTVKIFEVYALDQEFANDEEKKNILEKFNSTLKPFIEEFSEKIDKFVKMYKQDTEGCKEKVDTLKDIDTPKYKIAIFFTEYRKILEKMGTPPPETAPTPELIELSKDAIKGYIETFDSFCQRFLNVKTLHEQSELFRAFYSKIFPIAGINPDTIVGEQLSSFTRTAAPDLKITDDEIDPNLQEAEGDEEQPQRQLTKDISQNAKVIERHANAIVEILEGYEKYLNIDGKKGKGVEQGSRILFKKFGESDPRKLLYKFVKLIVKDIDSTVSIMDDMISLANKASGTEQINEAEVDNSARDLPVRDKIILVIKTGKKICDIGERLKDMIAKTETDGQEKEKEEEAPQQAQPESGDLEEAATLSSDATLNADPTGTDKGPRDFRNMQSRQGDEIQIGYKELAKQIYDLMNKIRPLFPTSQPFDTNYDFSIAMETFKAALTGLSSHVAQVSGFEFDQVTSSDVLSSFKRKLVGFKKVIKDVFGFGKDTKDSKNQASFNEEGENSGMPHSGSSEDKNDEGSSDTKELGKKLEKIIEEYNSSHFLLRLIMTTGYEEEFEEDSSLIFEPLQSSQKGKIVKTIEKIKTSNKSQTRSLDMEEKKIESEIEKASDGDFKSSSESLESSLITWLKRIINSKDIMTITEKQEDNTGEKARIAQVGKSMIEAMALYYLIKRVSEKINEEKELNKNEIKEMDVIIKDFEKNMRIIVTILNRYPIKKELDEKSTQFYKNFHRFKIPGFIATGKKSKDEKSNSGGEDQRPPESDDNSTSPRRRTPPRQGTQTATNEQKLAKILKPLIKEMLTKGK